MAVKRVPYIKFKKKYTQLKNAVKKILTTLKHTSYLNKKINAPKADS